MDARQSLLRGRIGLGAGLVLAGLCGCGRDDAGPAASSVVAPSDDAAHASDAAVPEIDADAPFPGDPEFTPEPVGPDPSGADDPPPAPCPLARPRLESLSPTGRAALEDARRAGKPLLAVLAPSSVAARRERAGALEALLRCDAVRGVLALAVVACVPATDASALGAPSADGAPPFALLVETDGRTPFGATIALPTRLRLAVREGELERLLALHGADGRTELDLDAQAARLRALAESPAGRGRRSERTVDAFLGLARTIEALVAGEHRPRRVAAARAVWTDLHVASMSASVRRGIRLAPEVADAAAAIVFEVGETDVASRTFARRLLADGAGRRLVDRAPAGSAWAGAGPRWDAPLAAWCGTAAADGPAEPPRLVILPPRGP